jgi:hypothetical protein
VAELRRRDLRDVLVLGDREHFVFLEFAER